MIIWLASGNAHKAEEFNALAAAEGRRVLVRSPREIGGMPEVAEDTGTFAGNARKKALALRGRLAERGLDGWVLADDSGLCVDELGGAPGVESAYYAGPSGDAAANRARLLAALPSVPDERRGAHFFCLLLVLGPDGVEHRFEGRCEGRIRRESKGAGGFGYDPLFVPAGEERSLAEMAPEEKNAVSHRARAWRRLGDWLVTRDGR